ncbi:MAG: cytochrome c-type biogenesis protein CcmH [Alphaproteobacteria bacterium]|nr:cytochrome c-type biogenesis protein CcmH [Alphaproteobacteria bacterium]
MRLLLKALSWLVACGLSVTLALAAMEPDEILPDPAKEKRARGITKELRCVVCQNQSVDDSDAPLAKDIRLIVRERIMAGETDEQVRAFVVARYGQYVLLRPPLGVDTALIWIGPFALLAIALGIAAVYLRRARVAGEAAAGKLSPDEEQRLEAILKDDSR